jgi:hypothetical protein
VAPAQPNAETDGRTATLWPMPSGGHHKINSDSKIGTSRHSIVWSGGHISHINHGSERIPSLAVAEGDGSGRSDAGRGGIERRGRSRLRGIKRSRRGEIQDYSDAELSDRGEVKRCTQWPTRSHKLRGRCPMRRGSRLHLQL